MNDDCSSRAGGIDPSHGLLSPHLVDVDRVHNISGGACCFPDKRLAIGIFSDFSNDQDRNNV